MQYPIKILAHNPANSSAISWRRIHLITKQAVTAQARASDSYSCVCRITKEYVAPDGTIRIDESFEEESGCHVLYNYMWDLTGAKIGDSSPPLPKSIVTKVSSPPWPSPGDKGLA